MKPFLTGSVLGVCLLLGIASHGRTAAPEPAASKLDEAARAEELKQKQAAERFLTVLEKSPRRGTALDRLYGFHVEAGTLEEFTGKFEERTKASPKDGAAWMILGLIESQRGRDAKAVEAFRQAESVLTDSPLASYYLGQSLVLIGQPEEAAAAFERAISRKPQRADLLDVFQALGRVYQRAQKGEQALAVWNRLEKLFPEDLRVQEQIAVTLAEEGQHDQALPRFEALAGKVKDEYRAATFRIEAADLKVRLGKSKEALADFEKLLSRLNPDNWLYRDVRRRIDDVFLKNDDQAGLAAYYEEWVGRNPEDIEAMTRLGRILAGAGRTPEARKWLDKALERAPSRKDLRLALIEQLVADKEYTKAGEQYEILAKNDPGNPDYLREWGRLILKDTARPEAERKAAATAVWQKLTAARSKDSLTATQVADLFRHAEMPDEALALYRKAVELSPESAQYREYLGEYFHTLKRRDEALATWREIVEGKKRTPENLARLAEVLAGFGYLNEAIENILAAAKADDDEFKYPLKAAELLSRAEKYDEALGQLDIAGKLADSAENSEAVMVQRLRNLQLAEKLDAEIETLKNELGSGKETTASRWFLLARYLEANQLLPEATQAIAKAIALDEKSVPARTTQARIQESSGSLQEAAETYRQLAAIDRRLRTGHLTQVARLEAQLGRIDQALQAGRDLLEAAPGNAENHEFFAQLCFQLGRTEDGLEALRRSVRLNPTDPKGMLTLAAALAAQFRTDEAVEMYWRAFDKSPDLDARLAIVPRLSELYLQTNHLERLVERFERERREQGKQREMTICLAQVYHSAGDYGTARQELEHLLSQNVRDTQLLQQLSNLAESEGDLPASIKFQQQLVALAPAKEGEMRLAQLLTRFGNTEEAAAIWLKLTMNEDDPAKLLASVDQLLSRDRRDTALGVIEKLLRDQPQNWELLYREGVAIATEKPADAAQRFQTILSLRLPDDEPGTQAKARARQLQNSPQAAALRAGRPGVGTFPLQDRMQMAYQVRRAIGLDRDAYMYQGSGMAPFWGPDDFGQARMAANGWLLKLAGKEGKTEEFIEARRKALSAPDPDARELWDWYYLQQIRQDTKELGEAARRLSGLGDPLAQMIYLISLSNRGQERRNSRQNQPDSIPPLPPGEVDHVLACYRSVQQKRPELLVGGGYYGQIAISNVLAELKRAERTNDEKEIYQAALQVADRPENRLVALQLASARGDYEAALALFDKLAEAEVGRSGKQRTPGSGREIAGILQPIVADRAEAGAHRDIIRIVDRAMHFTQLRRNVAAAGAASGRRRSSASPQQGGAYVAIYSGRNRNRGIRIDFPLPNEYFDQGMITLLRQVLENYKKDDLLSDLFSHFQNQSANVPEGERIGWTLGLAYLHWWNEQPTQAIAELERAVALVPADAQLRTDLATLYEKQQQFDLALKTVEQIVALDHQAMQQRETMALRLSVRSGDVERARQAAERLFGLRLDAETQVQLAAEMRSLGMHEHAEAVLARAQRQAGNRSGALISLMLQYQAEQKTDLAVQVAHQILRRGAPTSLSNRVRGYSTEDDSARQQALSVLGRSGRLTDLIERAEAQLKVSPSSVQLLQTLGEYYQASGNREKGLELLKKQAELRPDDATLRYSIGQQMSQMGKPADAIEHYRAAIKSDPTLLSRSYYEVQQSFRQANKLPELLALIDEIDVKAMGQYYNAINLVQNITQDDQNRDAVLRIFRKVWNAFPEQRANLLGSLYREELWQLPEVVEYGRQAIFPSDSVVLSDPWGVIGQITSYMGDGKVAGVMNRMLDAAVRQNRLPQLRKEVEESLAKHPNWAGGKALLAVILTKSGEAERARPMIEELLGDKKNPVPTQAAWVMGQELENNDVTRPLALKLYEGTINQTENQVDYSYSPLRRLSTIYQKEGHPEKAREMLMKIAVGRSDDNYDPAYAAYQRVQNLGSVGNQLVELGFSVDAIKIFSQIFDNEETLQYATQFGGDYYLNQARTGYDKALKEATSKGAAAALATWLKPRSEGERKPGEPVLDLVLLVHPKELNRAALTSIVVNAVSDGAASEQHRAEVTTRLADLTGQFPDDISVQLLAASAALARGDSAAIEQSLSRLEVAVDRTPLEALPAGGKANARQRLEAAGQIALWLVARDCLRTPERKALGEKLADRALEAARRQADPKQGLALLREWGQVDFDSGNRPSAEARFKEMLNLVLPARPAQTPMASPPANPVPVPSAAPAGACGSEPCSSEVTSADTKSDDLTKSSDREIAQAQPAPGSAPPRSRTAGPTRPRNPEQRGPAIPPATVSQFIQAADIALLAVEHEMPGLSLQAMRQALQAGPPVKTQQAAQGFGSQPAMMRARSARRGEDEDTSTFQQVADRVTDITRRWDIAEIAAADQYAVLLAIVLPEARPTEIFLYPRSLAGGGDLRSPRSVGKLLTHAAVKAGQAEDLRAKVEARQNSSLAKLPANVLLALLAQESGDAGAARASLDAIQSLLQADTLQYSADLACHVALPVLERDDLAESALKIVETAADRFSTNQSGSDEPAGSLLKRAARTHLRRKNSDAARKSLQKYLDVTQQMNARYGGDYGLYRRKLQVQEVCLEYAQAGLVADAMDMLGQFADMPRYQQGDPPLGNTIAFLEPQLLRLPAAKRYELLKKWTLPEGNRMAFRLISDIVSRDQAPDVFQSQSLWNKPVEGSEPIAGNTQATRALSPSLVSGGSIVSSLDLLLDAARELGKLEELAAEVKDPAERKLDKADVVALRLAMVRGEIDKARDGLKQRIAGYWERFPAQTPPNTPPKQPEWFDHGLAVAALAIPELRPEGDLFLRMITDHAKRVGNTTWVGRCRYDLNRFKASSKHTTSDAGLAYWHSADARAWWLASADQVGHVVGSDDDFLYFDWPIAGEFEFSVEAPIHNWDEGNFGYAGLGFEPLVGADVGGRAWPVGRHETLQGGAMPLRWSQFNRLTLRVLADRIHILVNGERVYEAKDPSPTSPWLALFTTSFRGPVFRDLSLTGSITIPREVPLIYADRMEGWVTTYFGESQPPRLTIGQPDRYRQNQALVARDPNPNAYNWSTQEGVLSGRRNDGQELAGPAQSWTYYHRPMRNGEKVRYEFLYQPGAVETHPAIGRLAFLLTPEKTRLHWITHATTELPDPASGLPIDNAVDEPGSLKGSPKLPLKPGEWNSAQISLVDDTAIIELNGVEIVRRPLEPSNSRQLGFFHDPNQTAVKVRNVVLTGDWPKEVSKDVLANLLRSSSPKAESGEVLRIANEILDEKKLALNSDAVQRKARALSPAARYDFLRAWVLPAEDHAAFRLQGRFLPVNPASAAARGSDSALKGARVRVGGTLTAPALDLVATARELNRLKELRGQVEGARAESDFDRRNRLALLALIALASGDETGATTAFAQLHTLLGQLSTYTPVPERWPELVAAEVASAVPATRSQALAILDLLVQQARRDNLGEDWQIPLRAVRSRTEARLEGGLKPEAEGGFPLRQWSPVSHTTSEAQGRGAPLPLWKSQRGEVRHAGGAYGDYLSDYLYFQSPLTGNFEVTAKLTSFGGRETKLGYAGSSLGPAESLQLEVRRHGGKVAALPLAPPLEKLDEWFDARLVVQDGTMQSFVNGRKVHEQPLPPRLDPWLVIQSGGWAMGGVRDLRIVGSPTIPEQLEISEDQELTGWLPTYFSDWISNDGPWKRDGDEIVGTRNEKIHGGAKRQSLLAYHRPMLEDGEFEYEFFYEPGKTHVHPAIDRAAFLLQPAGVQLHWLTDAQYERSDTSPGNVVDDPAIRRGNGNLPLREREWNKLLISLKGDEISISLNGQLIAQRALEPTNQRTFGLFHYADETAVRARKVIYRGSWPRVLPSIETQELATDPAAAASGASK